MRMAGGAEHATVREGGSMCARSQRMSRRAHCARCGQRERAVERSECEWRRYESRGEGTGQREGSQSPEEAAPRAPRLRASPSIGTESSRVLPQLLVSCYKCTRGEAGVLP